MIMADASRQEKLASAKKKLKQFQQRKATNTSPNKLSSTPGRNSPSKPQPLGPPGPFQNAGLQPPMLPRFDLGDQEKTKGEVTKSDDLKEFITPPRQENGRALPVNYRGSPKLQEESTDRPSSPFNKISTEKKFSPAEKIKQISNQLNGLITQCKTAFNMNTFQDVFINGDDPIIKEIEALEGRNHELEENLSSFKRSNQQLTNQVNEQRKQIIQLQEKLKKEKSDQSGAGFQEQKALKEQLEVHIQTIGILVSEKTELQGSVEKFQKKLQTKERENADTNSRLQAVRQRVVELERNLANVQMTCDKLQQTNKEVSDERDKLNSKFFELREKDETHQQNSELQEKLQTKVTECESLESNVSDLRSKLHKAELVVQQLSPGSKESETIEKLHKENEELEKSLNEQKELIQKLSSEKEELIERHREHAEQLGIHTEELQSKVTELEKQRLSLEAREQELQDKVHEVQAQLANVEDKEAEQQTEATHLAASEIQKLSDEKTDIENELDIQIRENRRLSKLVLDQDERIQDLESAVARMGEDAVDRVSLLENIQSDKETISRALKQNKALKDQLEELQDSFVKLTNDNAEMTNKLQSEQHANKELAAKFSEASLELVEYKDQADKRGQLIEDLQAEMTRVKEQLLTAASTVDQETTTYRTNIQKLQTELESQMQVNERLRHMQVQAELTDRLQLELQSAQDTINHLSNQNAELRQALVDKRVNQVDKESGSLKRRRSAEEQAANGDQVEGDHPRTKHFVQSPTPNESPVHNEYGTKTNLQTETSLSNEDEFHDDDDSEEEEDGSSEHDAEEAVSSDDERTRAPEQGSMVNAFREAMSKLEGERDEIYATLQNEREESAREMTKLRQHMEMQLQQQLRQQYRQIQEHFYQQLHEHQLKFQSLQETLDRYKKQEELMGADVDDNSIPSETLKAAFLQLQIRFRKVMEEKATLSDKIQEMEHKNLQLASECETIGEYIDLYRTQRLALKEKFMEKDRLISQLSNDHARMQTKVSQLEQLVMQVISERSGMELEKKQLQELVNRRLAVQSGNEPETEVPKLDFSVTSDVNDTTVNELLEQRMKSVENNNTSLDETSKLPENEHLQMSTLSNDGTAQQILQIFEQLHNTEEGYQKGWLSPVVRRRAFTPCKYCSNRLINI